jgi:hypothetical protein
MARVIDALLNNQAYSRGASQPMLNPAYGGQMGYSPDLTEWVNNAAYVRRNVICLLLEAPRFFQLMPNPQKWVQTLRGLFERHPLTIEGLNRTLEVSTTPTPVGGGGEEQEEVTDVKRSRSTPSFAYWDKYGMPIRTFFHDWIQYGLMDPDTKFAGVGTLSNYPTDMLPDMYSATAIFIEPDPTHRQVVQAFLTTNMFPKNSGEIVAGRDITNALQMNQITIPFSGITQTGLQVNAFAQTLLDSLSITNANPYTAPAFFDGISADVAAQVQGSYGQEVADLAATAMQVA